MLVSILSTLSLPKGKLFTLLPLDVEFLPKQIFSLFWHNELNRRILSPLSLSLLPFMFSPHSLVGEPFAVKYSLPAAPFPSSPACASLSSLIWALIKITTLLHMTIPDYCQPSALPFFMKATRKIAYLWANLYLVYQKNRGISISLGRIYLLYSRAKKRDSFGKNVTDNTPFLPFQSKKQRGLSFLV